MPTAQEIKQMNQGFLAAFEPGAGPGLEKKAIDAANDYTRFKMREEGFLRKLLPPIHLTEFDRSVITPLPVKIVDIEPDSPAAISVGFGMTPDGISIRANRYQVLFHRILTPRFHTDIAYLRTWHMDIRQILSDNSVKDMLAEEDNKWIRACNSTMIGANAICPLSGVAQWQTIFGGVTRDSVQDSMKILSTTPSRLEPKIGLINNITRREFLKWGRDEAGGDLSQDMLKNGWATSRFMELDWLITIKQDIVPTNTAFYWADPKFIGKFFTIEDTTLYVKREFYLLDYFAYEEIGASIGNPNSMSRADFV